MNFLTKSAVSVPSYFYLAYLVINQLFMKMN
ncbi:MAG: hypothetical protein ACI80S_001841 [Pseudohongiellaceae bacterium]